MVMIGQLPLILIGQMSEICQIPPFLFEKLIETEIMDGSLVRLSIFMSLEINEMFIIFPKLMLSTVLGLCFTKDSRTQKGFDHYLRESKRLLFVLKINSNAHTPPRSIAPILYST